MSDDEVREGLWQVWGSGEVHAEFRWGNLMERDHFKNPDVDGRIILKWLLNRLESLDWFDVAQGRKK
jgi:hypothetical protein